MHDTRPLIVVFKYVLQTRPCSYDPAVYRDVPGEWDVSESKFMIHG